MVCKEKYCMKYHFKACCFFCKDKEICPEACKSDVTVCAMFEEGEEKSGREV